MAQGRFEQYRRSTSRKKKKRTDRILVGAILTLIVLIVILVIVMIGSGVLSRGGDVQQQTEPDMIQQTQAPTEATDAPTEAPTQAPTESPTEAPTEEPTQAPTEEPTEAPTEAPTQAPTDPPPSEKGDAVAAFAKNQTGKPYLFGGSGPDSFDTTGFIYYCFQSNGIDAPRNLQGQASYGVEVSVDDLQPGDVLFFWTSNPGEVEYPAIYVGDGMLVAARNPENPVSEMSFTMSYFSERFLFARRYY